MAEATSVPKEQKQVKIGDYVVTGKIGQGGIAEIFKGRQESLNRDVAIRFCRRTCPAMRISYVGSNANRW